MLQCNDFKKLVYEDKKASLLSIFYDIQKQYNINCEDFLFVLGNSSQISENSLDTVYGKLFSLKEIGKDTYFFNSGIKNIINELKDDIVDGENSNDILASIK